ncbi:MAG: hypothetical protein KC457_07295 [Myxococcales bacterium]|nr:hypothetical protein [Myxococcales bacterium]
MSEQLRIDGGSDRLAPPRLHNWLVPRTPSAKDWECLMDEVLEVVSDGDLSGKQRSTDRVHWCMSADRHIDVERAVLLGALRRLRSIGLVESSPGVEWKPGDAAEPSHTIENGRGRALPFWHLTDKGRAWMHRAGEAGR